MKKIGITILLIFVNIVAIILLINFYNKDESEMMVSNINNHSSDVSIMIQSLVGSNTYTKSTSETWPDSTKYHLNPSKSYCKNGSSYSLSGSKVLVNLKRADDCYFYFDLGATITFSILLYQNNYGAPKPDLYTNGNYMVTFSIPYNKSISSLCVTDEPSPKNCIWGHEEGLASYINSYNNGFSGPYNVYNPVPLSGGDGLKTLYAYLKDSSNNIYGYQSDTITLDNTPPTCSINVNSSGITSSVNDNYYTVIEFKKDGTNISGNNTSLAIGKYNLKVWDGAGNECNDSKEIASNISSYSVTISCCGAVGKKPADGQVPPYDSSTIWVEYCVDSVPPKTYTYNMQSCNPDVGKWCSVDSCIQSSSSCESGFKQISGTNYCYK